MKKKKTRTPPKRHYDHRIVLLFVVLFAVCFALSYLRSRFFHTPLFVSWNAFWSAPKSPLTSLQYSLLSFEVLLAWVSAAFLCAEDKSVSAKDPNAETDHSSDLWTVALTGLPLCINCVSDLSIWAYYSVFMLVTAWLIGKKTSFAHPVGKGMFKSVYNETADITVRTRLGAESRFRRHSGFWISCLALVVLFILTVIFFIKAY